MADEDGDPLAYPDAEGLAKPPPFTTAIDGLTATLANDDDDDDDRDDPLDPSPPNKDEIGPASGAKVDKNDPPAAAAPKPPTAATGIMA